MSPACITFRSNESSAEANRRVREGRVREWANAVAERDAERRKAAEKKPRRA